MAEETKLTKSEKRGVIPAQATDIIPQQPTAIQPTMAGAVVQQPSPTAVVFADYVKNAGKWNVNEEQAKILSESVKDEDIQLRPDGQLYASWDFFADKLNRAFPFRWRLVPLEPKANVQNDCILWTHYLIIDNAYVAHALGQCEYRAGNPSMSYGDAIEGAISNALMRCCKHINIGKELWNKKFREEWMAKNAVCEEDLLNKDKWGKPKKKWRLKTLEDKRAEQKRKDIDKQFDSVFDAKISSELDKKLAESER